VLSGLFEGWTTGTPLSFLVRNRDQRSRDYEPFRNLFRPGHADLTYQLKYGLRDHRGGGRASARETVGRVIAGAVARQVLEPLGVQIWAHTCQIGAIRAQRIVREEIERNPVRCADPEAAAAMVSLIEEVRDAGDSIGSAVALHAEGVPAGLGEPVFDRCQAELARAWFSIPAVKAVAFGPGFGVVERRGSENNDPLLPDGSGGIAFGSNNAAGTLGGITTGQPILARIAFKPPSSIGLAQKTVDTAGRPRELRLEGRHDPCIAPRAVPVVEAMTAMVLLDLWLRDRAGRVAAGEQEE